MKKILTVLLTIAILSLSVVYASAVSGFSYTPPEGFTLDSESEDTTVWMADDNSTKVTLIASENTAGISVSTLTGEYKNEFKKVFQDEYTKEIEATEGMEIKNSEISTPVNKKIAGYDCAYIKVTSLISYLGIDITMDQHCYFFITDETIYNLIYSYSTKATEYTFSDFEPTLSSVRIDGYSDVTETTQSQNPDIYNDITTQEEPVSEEVTTEASPSKSSSPEIGGLSAPLAIFLIVIVLLVIAVVIALVVNKSKSKKAVGIPNPPYPQGGQPYQPPYNPGYQPNNQQYQPPYPQNGQQFQQPPYPQNGQQFQQPPYPQNGQQFQQPPYQGYNPQANNYQNPQQPSQENSDFWGTGNSWEDRK